MEKKELLQRLEDVQLKLEAKVGEAHGELNDLVSKAEGFGREQYNEAMTLYTEAVQELDDFLKNAKEQKKRLITWVVSNKVQLAIGGGLFLLGMIVAAILIAIGPVA
jgi:vacuolar-type H+-ATPase subunit H